MSWIRPTEKSFRSPLTPPEWGRISNQAGENPFTRLELIWNRLNNSFMLKPTSEAKKIVKTSAALKGKILPLRRDFIRRFLKTPERKHYSYFGGSAENYECQYRGRNRVSFCFFKRKNPAGPAVQRPQIIFKSEPYRLFRHGTPGRPNGQKHRAAETAARTWLAEGRDIDPDITTENTGTRLCCQRGRRLKPCCRYNGPSRSRYSRIRAVGHLAGDGVGSRAFFTLRTLN